MIKSTCLSFLFLLISVLQVIGQTNYSQNDIQGEWEATQGYSITISGNEARISSLGKTNFPLKLLGEIFYSEITHKVDNQWTARRFQWRYPGSQVEDGRWIDEGIVSFSMSADKNSFSQGSRSFSRVTPIQLADADLPIGTKKNENVDYSGVIVDYTIARSSSGNIVVHAKAQNTHKNVLANFVISSPTGSVLINQRLYPGFSFTSPIPAQEFKVSVTFEALAEGASNSEDVLQLLRKEFGQLIGVKDGQISVGEKTTINKYVGGSRG